MKLFATFKKHCVQKTCIALAVSSICSGAIACNYNTTFTNSSGTLVSGDCINTSNVSAMSDVDGSINFSAGSLDITASGHDATTDIFTGINAKNGNSIALSAATNTSNPYAININVTGDGNNSVTGVESQNSSKISIANSSITANAGANDYFSNGVLSINNGDVDIANSKIIVNGGVANGIDIYQQSTASLDNTSITVAGTKEDYSGISSTGISVGSDSTLSLNNVSIISTGYIAEGISNSGGNSSVITLTGNNSIDVKSSVMDQNVSGGNAIYTSFGVINQSGSLKINVVGNNMSAVYATDSSKVSLNDVTINLGGGSTGVFAYNKSSIVLNGSNTITSNSSGKDAVTIFDSSSITLNDTTINLLGDNLSGIASISGGRITLTGNNYINLLGASGVGVGFVEDSGNSPQVLDNLSVIATSLNSNALYISGDKADSNLTFNNSTLSSSKGNSIYIENGAAGVTRTLNFNNSKIIGDVQVDANSSAVINLNENSTLTGSVDPTTLNIDSTSLWNITSNSTINNLYSSGTIAFVGNVGNNLTVQGDYVANAGLIKINTVLGDDNSVSDKLIVKGSTSGTTHVVVNNVGGLGASTHNGIEIVTVDGASNGVFTLQGRVAAGAYEYGLFQGTPNSKDGNWYLRSTEWLRPESAGYIANQNTSNTMFMQTLHERLGETNYFSDAKKENNLNGSVWARVAAYHQDSEAANGKLDNRSNTSLLQIGTDILRWQANGERILAGLMFSAGKSSNTSRAFGNQARANSTVNGYAMGIYATLYAKHDENNQGLYVDSWLQYGRYSNSVKGDELNKQDYDSHNWMASLETGYSIALNSNPNNSWFIEPQAQLIHTNYQQDSITEDSGTQIKSENNNSWSTRLGTRVFARHAFVNGMKVKPFAELNWLYKQNNGVVNMDGTRINSDVPNNLAEIKFGAESELAHNWNVWWNIGYQQGSNGYQQTQGNIGMKYIW